MKRILVTGAEGFTGRILCRLLLDQGYEVHGLMRTGTEPAGLDPALVSHELDLRSPEAIDMAVASARPDGVIHLAGIASPVHGNVDEIYATNLVGTRHLLDALARQGTAPQSVILASSANVYDPALSGQIDESSAVGPVNDYGVSKLAMEHLRGVFGSRLPIVVVRPFNYTGVGQSAQFVIPKIVGALRSGAARVELGNIDVSRDWSDVRFVADCYARLLAAPEAVGGVFNICSGVAISLREVISRACRIAGRSLEIGFNPTFARANEISSLWGSNLRLANAIGPLAPVPIEETLRWMLEAEA